MDHAPRGGVSAPTATPTVEPTEAPIPDLAAVDALRELHANGGRVPECSVELDHDAIEALRSLHAGGGRVPVTEVNGSAASASAASTPSASASADSETGTDGATCPMPAFIRGSASSCPVMAGRPADDTERSRADLFMRKLLRIQDPPADQSEAEANRHFRRSMTISGIRCTLTYVIFPIVLPLFSFLQGVGPFIGVLVGSVALVFDTLTVRRFFAVDHRYRWPFSAIAGAVMVLLVILLVQDGMALGRHLLG